MPLGTAAVAALFLLVSPFCSAASEQGAVEWRLGRIAVPSTSAQGDVAQAEYRLPESDHDVALIKSEVDSPVDASKRSVGAESGLVDRIAELEENYETFQKSHEELSASMDDYVESGHSESTMTLSGRIHADLWAFPDSSPGVNGFESGDPDVSPQDRLGFRRVRFGVQGELPSNMLYKIEMEFAEGADPEFRDAYIGWEELPLLQTVLIGNQKRPYGLDHINSSRFNVFLERPFVIEGFNQDSRRFGVQSYGFSSDLAYNWQYGVFNQRLIQDEGNYLSDHWQGQVAGRLANTLWYDECSGGRGFAHFAVSGTWADTDENQLTPNYALSGTNEAHFRTRPEARSVFRWLNTGVIPGGDEYRLLGLESVVNVGPVQVVGEYQKVWLDRAGDSQLGFSGEYAYVSYFLTGEHMPWDRESGQLGRPEPFENFFLVDTERDGVRSGMGAWQVAARYSHADFADDDILGGIGDSFTLGLNWYWTAFSRMQFNYIYGDIHDNQRNAAAGAPDYGHYQIVGGRFMVDF